MLNPTKGGSHTSDKMIKENERYKKHEIYNNRNITPPVERNLPRSNQVDHKLFIIHGKYDFDGLDLSDCGWEGVNLINPKQKKFLETTSGYKDYKEDIIYKGPQGNAIMHLNKKTDIHKLKINLNIPSDDTMNMLKSMFELGLGCICYDEENLPEGLIKKIQSVKRIKAEAN
jgi:hypothetical protein